MSTPEAVSQQHVHGIDFEGQALSARTLIVFDCVYRIQALILCPSKTRALASRNLVPLQVTYLSKSFSFATSKSPSHPTSMRTLTPPSSSNKD